MKNKISIEKIKSIIYFTGCLIFLVSLAFFENVTTFFPHIKLTQLLCFGFLLVLSMLKVIDREITKQNNSATHTTLSTGLALITKAIPNIQTLNIYASSSSKIVPSFCNEHIHIRQCKIIVYTKDENEKNALQFNQRIDSVLDDWHSLVNKRVIEDLKIKYTTVKPTHYMVLVNNQFLLHGTYDFVNTQAEVSANDPALLSNESNFETIEINKQYKWFSSFFDTL